MPLHPDPPRGLTLIELLIALVLLSVLAVLGARGLAGLGTAQQIAQEHLLQWRDGAHALAQWDTDLDALLESGHVPALAFDGRVLRLTRQSPDGSGWLVVAWGLHPGGNGGAPHWSRWASAALSDPAALQQAWAQAAQWPANPAPLALWPVKAWRLFYHREGAWSHPLSASGAPQSLAPIPDGIRLELDSADGRGTWVRDWARPGRRGSEA